MGKPMATPCAKRYSPVPSTAKLVAGIVGAGEGAVGACVGACVGECVGEGVMSLSARARQAAISTKRIVRACEHLRNL